MKTEYINDSPYPKDLQQEVDRRVVKCIRFILEFVNTLSAIMIFDTFNWGVCSSPLCTSWLFICGGNPDTDHETASESALKKQNKNSSLLGFH
jgi:hypothetical protein